MSLLDNFYKKQSAKNKKDILFHIAPFIGVALLFIIFIFTSVFFNSLWSQKGDVLGMAKSAELNLEEAEEFLSQAQLQQAEKSFEQASSDFQKIESTLSEISSTLQPLDKITTAPAARLIRAGKAISASGKFLSNSLESLAYAASGLSGTLTLNSSRGDDDTRASINEISINKSLNDSLSQLLWAKDLLELAESEMDSVNTSVLPENISTLVVETKDKVRHLNIAVSTLSSYNSLLADVTQNYQTNILMLFQNTAETRPTGGFIGSYGLLKILNGNASSFLIESIYEIDGRLVEKTPPPEPLRPIAGDKWALRDSNWWPDFEVSAQKIEQFYEWEAGESVDLTIAFTPEVFEQIIGIVGPLRLEEYELTIGKDNFYEIVQTQTSTEYNARENKPKKFMADLADEMLSQLPNLSIDEKLTIFGAFIESINQKNLLLYSRHENIQRKIEQLGISGNLLNVKDFPNSNLLLITNANVGGGKTDRYIKQDVELKTNVKNSGRVTNVLKIKRTSNAPKNMEHSTNKNYIRIYVPPGSRLLKSNTPMKTLDELDRTVFAGFMTTSAGENSEIVIEYELPLTHLSTNSHSFILEKNPGQKIDSFKYSVSLPEGKSITRIIGSEHTKTSNNTYTTTVSPALRDYFLGVVFE